jgi:hypothetical protein
MTHPPISSAEHHFVSLADNQRTSATSSHAKVHYLVCMDPGMCICLGSIVCDMYGHWGVHLHRFHRAQLITQPLQVRFRFRPPKNLNWTESSVLSGSGSRFTESSEPDPKSGSRFGEICPEPD